MHNLFIYTLLIFGITSMAAQVKTASPQNKLKPRVKNQTMLALQKVELKANTIDKITIKAIRREV